MLTKLIHAYKARRIQREFMLLELEEMAAHANAEENVVKAQRALEDAQKRQERAKDDAQMKRRWETAKLRIEQKYLDAAQAEATTTAEVFPIKMEVSK